MLPSHLVFIFISISPVVEDEISSFDSLFQQIGVVRCLYVLSMVYQISSSMFVSVYFSGFLWNIFLLNVCMNIVHIFSFSVQLYDNHPLFGFQNDFIIVLSLSLLLSSRISCACVCLVLLFFLFLHSSSFFLSFCISLHCIRCSNLNSSDSIDDI